MRYKGADVQQVTITGAYLEVRFPSERGQGGARSTHQDVNKALKKNRPKEHDNGYYTHQNKTEHT